MALVPKNGNDVVYTPDYLAQRVVEFCEPCGVILEPCCGGGVFVTHLEKYGSVVSGDIEQGWDFFDFTGEVDWVVTNPPWSKARNFLIHSMELSNNICFLITINHFLGLKARFRDMDKFGFWPTKVLLLDTPKEFPQSGFQLGAVVIQKTDTKTTIWVD